jgi:hypothetical protein
MKPFFSKKGVITNSLKGSLQKHHKKMKGLTTLFYRAVRDNIILRRGASLSTLYGAVRDNII